MQFKCRPVVLVAGVLLATLSSLSGLHSVRALEVSDLRQAHLLPPPDAIPRNGADYGYSVAISGDYLVVGAPREAFTGSAFVFGLDRSSGSWLLQDQLLPSDGKASDSFGYSVSISGTIAVVGAPGHDPSGVSNAGAAYVYQRESAQEWIEASKLVASTGTIVDPVPLVASAWLGWSVAIDDGTIAVGAPNYYMEDMPKEAGAVFIFLPYRMEWERSQILTHALPDNGDFFGWSVGLSKNYLAVGVPRDDGAGEGAGAVCLFEQEEGSWQLSETVVARDATAFDQFGRTVAISGDNLVVGAPTHMHDGNFDSGAAYLFTKGRFRWTEAAKLTASDSSDYDTFGSAVGISNEVVVVGAPKDDNEEGIDAGSIYVFPLNSLNEEFKMSGMDSSNFDRFGTSVAVSGTSIVVGSPDSDYSTGGTANIISPLVPIEPTPPTPNPTTPPTLAPTSLPTSPPTPLPTPGPTPLPTPTPTTVPTSAVSSPPTRGPTDVPTVSDSSSPTDYLSELPTASPSLARSLEPSTFRPFVKTTGAPTETPSEEVSQVPSNSPSVTLSMGPSKAPSRVPTSSLSGMPSTNGSSMPSVSPSSRPTRRTSLSPSVVPSKAPSRVPTSSLSGMPSTNDSTMPSVSPSSRPTGRTSLSPSVVSSLTPTIAPTSIPSIIPSQSPTVFALSIVGFTLVNSRSNLDIFEVMDGATIDVNDVNIGTNLNMRADYDGSRCSYVIFDWNGAVDYRTESVAPYALGGDRSGNYSRMPALSQPGSYTVTARPYFVNEDELVLAGESLTMSFTIMDSSLPEESMEQDSQGGGLLGGWRPRLSLGNRQ